MSQTKGKDWQREKPGEPLGVKSWVGIEGDDTDKCGGSRPIAKAAGASSQAAAGAIATAQSLTGRSHDVRHSNRRSDGGDNDNKGGK